MEPALTATGLSVSYAGRTVLDSVTLSLARSELTALIGPNGAGKSTLLGALAGVLPCEGSISCTGSSRTGNSCTRPAAGIAFVPQRAKIRAELPLSATQVVATGCLHPRRWWSRPDRYQRGDIAEAMALMGITRLAQVPFRTLSGGQAQRVLLARALVQQPEVLLLDEPYTGLDPDGSATLNECLARLSGSGTAVLAAVHDLAIARQVFHRVIALERGVLVDGSSAEVFSTARGPASGPWAAA